MNLKVVGVRGQRKTKHKKHTHLALKNNYIEAIYFYICIDIMEILSADFDVDTCLWSRFLKKLYLMCTA